MRSKVFALPGLSPVRFAINYAELDGQSALNHHETHIHKEYEIYLNLSGNVSFEVQSRLYPVSRGSVVLSKPYEYHRCVYHSDTLHRHYWIIFSADGIEALFPSLFYGQKGFDNLFQLSEEVLSRIVDIFEQLLSDQISPLDKQIGFLQMLRLIEQGQQIAPSQEYAGLSPDVVRALQYVDAHLTEELDMKVLSAASYVSVNTLERHFKKQLNLSPTAMIRKKRLIESMMLLRSGYSISEAAAGCGFSDHSNYIQHFKKQFGMTPLQYKKNLE